MNDVQSILLFAIILLAIDYENYLNLVKTLLFKNNKCKTEEK